MHNAIRWIVRNALLLVLFTVILGLGSLVIQEIKRLDTANDSIAALDAADDRLRGLEGQLSSHFTKETQDVVGRSLEAQQRLLTEVERDIKDLQGRVKSPSQLLVLLAIGRGRDLLDAHVRLELRKQQRRYLETLIRHTAAAQDVETAQRQLARLWREHKEIYSELEANREAQERLRRENWGPDWNPLSDGYEEIQQLKTEEERILRENKAAHDAYQRQKSVIETKSLPARPGPFLIDTKSIEKLRSDIKDEVRNLQAAQRGNWVVKLGDVFKPFFKPAMLLWLAYKVVPLALRALFYRVLAPIATRLPPIHIDKSQAAPPVPKPSESAVSVPIEVSHGNELLVKSAYLQSSSQVADKQTQWLLNASFPFASLAAGLWALTRVRPRNNERTMVMVSCQEDALGEVGLVHLPAGSAMVVQPRSLAGVLKPSNEPVKMSRHWRLKSLHAWLTWQLRYLVFHGPCTLIVKGCRGIRAEAPSASSPRLIRQSATLAFSANLGYQTVRHATFWPYFRGREDLFCDLFSGGPGLFVYEEMPSDSANGVSPRRGVEGIADAVLKVFGI